MSSKKRNANNLDGRTWTRYSISVWNDINKNSLEKKLKHPALFPLELVERLLNIFTLPGDVVFDPFMGSGSTLLGALQLGRRGVGMEISRDYNEMVKKRLEAVKKEEIEKNGENIISMDDLKVIEADARNISQHLAPASLDFCLTSPPYWDILKKKRSADRKPARYYGEDEHDLGNIDDYRLYLEELQKVFAGIYKALKTGKYCVVVVMDLRKKNIYYPLHMDLSNILTSLGFEFDDLIIWDRRTEYNNLRPLGFPYVFRINKVHEYILIFQKRS